MYYDALQDIEENIPDESDPNNMLGAGLIATFNSISDVDNFCNTYNHENGYNRLKLGQMIKIKSTKLYYSLWYIAGFDCEANNIAADGTSNNNGQGICLFPRSSLGAYQWHSSNVNVPYINSSIHTSTLSTISQDLIGTLGSHLVNRNVLLSSSINSETSTSASYTWTKSYCTLPSLGQITGDLGQYKTIYDDGEANYQLPLFKLYPESLYNTRNGDYNVTRNIYGHMYSSSGVIDVYFYEYIKATFPDLNFDFKVSAMSINFSGWEILPMIYIR